MKYFSNTISNDPFKIYNSIDNFIEFLKLKHVSHYVTIYLLHTRHDLDEFLYLRNKHVLNKNLLTVFYNYITYFPKPF